MELAVYKLNLASCLFMTGLIWLVQIVHYPSFNFIDREIFSRFSAFHQRRISLIVVPMMTLELLSALGLCWLSESTILHGLNLTALLTIWSATAFLSVPLHRILTQVYDENAIKKLVLTNWLRTTLWSVRSISLILFL